MPARYVYLGPEGTFAEQALRSVATATGDRIAPARGVPEALDAVREGLADAAMVPLENSVGGAVGITLDELAAGSPLVIIREVVLAVDFILAARPGTSRAGVARLAAHPQAATQCRAWLRANLPDAAVVEQLSNGAAAASVAAGEHDAAICAPIAAGRHNLAVLAKDVADNPDAMTRFVLVARPGPPPPATGDDVTSLAVYIAHDRVGALVAVLTELAVRGVNLTRIESRPTGESLGRYAFFLDCTGHVADARLGEALRGLRRTCPRVRFFGSYPRAPRPTPRREFASDAAAADGHAFAADLGPPSAAAAVDAAAWLARLRAGHPY